MSGKERKRFVTTIDPEILLNFKVVCTKQQKSMNEVLEVLMLNYSNSVVSSQDTSVEK